MPVYNNNNDPWSPSIAGIALYNPTSKIDKTSIQFNMWKTTLRISIIPAIESNTDETPRYDFKNSVNIWLTPLKAQRFAEILKAFKNDSEKFNNYGVPTPASIITVDRADTFGQKGDNAVISIRKVNEDGNIEMAYSYECNTDVLTTIVGFNASNPKNFKQDTENFKYSEIDYIIAMLEQYYLAMTGATAFSVIHHMYPFLDKIAAKLGVDISGQVKRNAGGFFNNNNGQGFNTTQNINQTNSLINGSGLSQSQPVYDASSLKNLVDSE